MINKCEYQEYPTVTILSDKFRTKANHILLLLRDFARSNWKRAAPNEQMDIEQIEYSELEKQIRLYLNVKYYQRFAGVGTIDIQSINDVESIITVTCSPGNRLLDDNRGEIYQAGLMFLSKFSVHLCQTYDVPPPISLVPIIINATDNQTDGENNSDLTLYLNLIPSLSENDKLIVTMVRQGEAASEIAKKVFLSKNRVQNRITELRKLLGPEIVPYKNIKRTQITRFSEST